MFNSFFFFFFLISNLLSIYGFELICPLKHLSSQKKSKSSCLTGSSCSCLSQILARRTIFGKGHARNDFVTKIKRKKINKFKESAWKCVYFLSAELLALVVSRYEPWFTNTKYFWVGPGDQIWPDQKTK